MDNTIIIGIVMIIGALMGTLFPYVLKVWKDPKIEFDWNYGYALVVTVLIQVAVLIPDDVPVLTFKVLITALAAGYGMQSFISKGVPK